MTSIEEQTAGQHAHRDHIAKVLEGTGGEVMHPDHHEIREAVRNAVLEALDGVSEEHGAPKVKDADLPALFRTLDHLSERLFLRREGLE